MNLSALPCRFIGMMPIKLLIKVMKLTTFLLLLFLQVSATGYSQKKLRVNFSNITLDRMIEYLESNSRYRFFYNNDEVDPRKMLTVKKNDVTVKELVAYITKELDLHFTERGNQVIVITKAPAVATVPASTTADTTMRLRGRVYNRQEPPVPLPGVTVMIKGTSKGVATDNDGFFDIEVGKGQTLIFSFTGFKPYEYHITNQQKNLTVSLEENVSGLNEVVVTGFSEQKVKHLASAVGSVNLSNLNNKPITQLSQALQGGVTGITVNQGSGLPGGDAAAIKIRGVGTFLNSEPLVLVDGVPFDMNKLDPNTIESITVLKDAAAASIYGARAGNGVILITTKRGKPGKVDVQYNMYSGFQSSQYIPDFVDAPTYMRMVNEAQKNNNADNIYDEAVIEATAKGDDPVKYPNTRWNDEVFRKKSSITSHGLTVSGGNNVARFMLSANYLYQDGMIKNSTFSRGTIRANTSVDLRKNIVVYMDLFASRDRQTEPYNWGYGTGTLIGWTYKAPPNIAAKYPDRPERPGYTYYGNYGESWNPVANIEKGGLTERLRDEVLINLRPKWELLPGLSLKGQFSYRVSTGADKKNQEAYIFFDYFTNKKYGRDFDMIKQAGPTDRSSYYYTGGNIDYDKTFNNHRVNIIAGYSSEMTNSGAWKEIGLISYFSKLYYSYADKYLLEAGIRRDGSSLFAPGRKWGNFPSIALGWNIHNEQFLKNISFLDQFKLRASYGKLGNNNIDPYQYQSTINSSGAETIFGNPNITWETIGITDIGTDLSFLKNKLNVTFDWYNKKTTNLIMLPAPTLTSAISKTATNIGSMKNAGWEIKAGYNGQIASALTFSANLGYSYNKTTLLEIAQAPLIEGSVIREVGGAFGQYYGYQTQGLLQEGDVEKGVPTYGIQKAGDIRYVDQDGNGIIDDKDRVKLGNTDPSGTYFGNLSLQFKNFDFEVLFTGTSKVPVFYAGRIALPLNVTGEGGTPMKWHQDYWTPENTGARFPRLMPSPGSNGLTSDFWMVNGAFVRVKYVQLGYNLPATLINKVKLNNLRIYLNAQNPLTFTKVEIMDPESRGDENTYPVMRTFTAGVNVRF